MTRDEAIEILESVSFFAPSDIDVDTAIDMAIEALDKLLPKPHDRLMYWETARRIIDSPRSKSQMLTVLDSVPPVEALERKYGKWIEIDDGLVKGYCSQCGWLSYYYENEIIGMNYCPNCGADMREGKEE